MLCCGLILEAAAIYESLIVGFGSRQNSNTLWQFFFRKLLTQCLWKAAHPFSLMSSCLSSCLREFSFVKIWFRLTGGRPSCGFGLELLISSPIDGWTMPAVIAACASKTLAKDLGLESAGEPFVDTVGIGMLGASWSQQESPPTKETRDQATLLEDMREVFKDSSN